MGLVSLKGKVVDHVVWMLNSCVQVTWKIGADTVVRGQFETNQTLDDTLDTDYRAINNDW